MFSEIQDALYSQLDQLEWMDEQTRQQAKVLVRAEGRSYWGQPFPIVSGEKWKGPTYFYLFLQAHNLK